MSPSSRSAALIVIDNAPLQHAAWSEFHAARKRSEKAARDLLRHEETDTPAYTAWLHGAFPQLVTSLRELHAEVIRKARDVNNAQFFASLSGRSVKKVWREHKEYEADPEAYERGPPPQPDVSPENETADSSGGFDADPSRAYAPQGIARSRQQAAAHAEARDVYRRLVQHLHPDRGGEWTPTRERLWHEDQQAWAARDADWLARLEIDWETANDTLSATSSISRLRRAIAELDAARRDTERRLRDYRCSPAWRFTLSEKKHAQLRRRLEHDLHADLEALQRQLAYLDATIASWESSPAGATRKPKHRR